MTGSVDWDAYAPCPKCFRTWSCIRIEDTRWLSDPHLRKTGWSRGWIELKRPHPGRPLKRPATETIPGV